MIEHESSAKVDLLAPPPDLNVLMIAGELEVRGRSTQMLTLAKRLAAKGVRARVVCTDASLLQSVSRHGVELIEIPSLTWPVVRSLAWRFLAHDLQKSPPDLIHVQQRRMLKLGNWLSQRIDRPYVLTIHDYLPPGESLAVDLRRVKRIIAVSESVRAELVQNSRLPPELVTVIASGVAEGNPQEPVTPKAWGAAPVVGNIGPLERVKGQRYLLEAAVEVLKTHPQTQFLIAGSGPDEHALRKLARDLRIAEQTTFMTSSLDLDVSLNAIDIFVLPSLKQGLGTIMLEAMARGIPVVATRAGGVYQVVSEGKTGLLVAPRDSHALAESIRSLLTHPRKARTLGENAAAMVRRDFPVDTMVQRTADLYREVLGRKIAKPSAAGQE